MSNPQPYKRGSAFGANVSGSLLNDELDAVAKANASTNDALADVRRSDGELNDGIVKRHTLHAEVDAHIKEVASDTASAVSRNVADERAKTAGAQAGRDVAQRLVPDIAADTARGVARSTAESTATTVAEEVGAKAAIPVARNTAATVAKIEGEAAGKAAADTYLRAKAAPLIRSEVEDAVDKAVTGVATDTAKRIATKVAVDTVKEIAANELDQLADDSAHRVYDAELKPDLDGEHAEGKAFKHKIFQTLENAYLALHSGWLNEALFKEELMGTGVVSVRQHGLKGDSYNTLFNTTHVSFAAAGIHDHADIGYRPGGSRAFTLGLPEVGFVSGGRYKRTRHVDPSTLQAVKMGADFLQTEIIEAGDIPAAVIAAGDGDAQIDEAREWIRAAALNDDSIRPFRAFTKMVLMCIESWQEVGQPGDGTPSFRHNNDESLLYDVFNRDAIYGLSGAKRVKENGHSVPACIVVNDQSGRPTIATDNYRWIAVELGTEEDVQPARCLHYLDDPQVRWKYNLSPAELEQSKYAHFAINVRESDPGDHPFEASNAEALVNKWMRKLPGLDNGSAHRFNLKEKTEAYFWTRPEDRTLPLNLGYYTNWYALPDDAVGRNLARTGWRDPSRWVALNNRPEVLGFTDQGIHYGLSYAFPFELVRVAWWQNPTWNPRLIKWLPKNQIKGDGKTPETAYSGWNEDHVFYLLPVELFDGAGVMLDSADTGAGFKWMRGGDGKAYRCIGTGMRIFALPVGGAVMRHRFPVFPIAWHNNPLHMEMQAMWGAIASLQAQFIKKVGL